MARVSATVGEAEKTGLERIADTYQMSQSEVVGMAVRRMIDDFDEDVPEWVRREAVHERLKQENNPYLRMIHFKQRCHEYLRDCLLDDNGRIKRFPPEPDKVEEHYIENLLSEIKSEYPEYEDEYIQHAKERMDWYRMMHPDSEAGDKRIEAINMIMMHLRHDNERRAERIASEASATLSESADDLMEQSRESMNDGGWRHQWDRATGGGLVK